MTVCYYHVTYKFQAESTICICLNVKELLARSRCHTWSLSNSNGIRTHNQLVRKRTLNHLGKLTKLPSLAKWLSVCLRAKYLWFQIPLLSFSWWFKPRFKSKFEWTSVHTSFNPHLNEAQKETYMKNDKTVSLKNLLQHSLSAEVLSEWNFQINARNKLTAKCLLTFSHYTRPHLKYGG